MTWTERTTKTMTMKMKMTRRRKSRTPSLSGMRTARELDEDAEP
jgi:hypothetical protein